MRRCGCAWASPSRSAAQRSNRSSTPASASRSSAPRLACIMKDTPMSSLSVVRAAVLALGLAVPLAAQSPAERAGLELLRDSLAAVRDSSKLKQLEATTIELAKKNRDDPIIHLRLGFIAYRLGELGGKSHYDDAAGEFEWCAELRPTWPYPWYGAGLAELAQGEHHVIGIENLRQMLRKDYLSKAARAFAKAAEADPTFADATVDLARTAMAQRIGPRL